jgi:arginine decarboxylase
MNEGRWVLLIASEVGGTDSVSDRAMERLVEAIRLEGYEVVRTSTPEDGLSLVTSDPSHSAILLDWDLEGENQFDERAALKILRAVRHRNKKIPIFLIADRTLVSELPLEVVKQVHEYIHLFGDTPAFIANRVDFAVERYHEQLLPPYFRELKKYNDQGAYSWDAPGHMGGVAFLKHPVGMEFQRFFGENIMRSDLGISTSQPGGLVHHRSGYIEAGDQRIERRGGAMHHEGLVEKVEVQRSARAELDVDHRAHGEGRQHLVG